MKNQVIDERQKTKTKKTKRESNHCPFYSAINHNDFRKSKVPDLFYSYELWSTVFDHVCGGYKGAWDARHHTYAGFSSKPYVFEFDFCPYNLTIDRYDNIKNNIDEYMKDFWLYADNIENCKKTNNPYLYTKQKYDALAKCKNIRQYHSISEDRMASCLGITKEEFVNLENGNASLYKTNNYISKVAFLHMNIEWLTAGQISVVYEPDRTPRIGIYTLEQDYEKALKILNKLNEVYEQLVRSHEIREMHIVDQC